MAAPVTPTSTFGTVLIARQPQDSPSPLELQIRHKSQRSRVVQKLSGGAHLLLPSSETTIALRAYYEASQHRQDDDGLVEFRDAYKYPIVFFILSRQEALGEMTSFVNRAQIIMSGLDSDSAPRKDGSTHVFIVPDVESAIQILANFVQSLAPERREFKRQFGASVAAKYLQKDHASLRVSTAFRNWAHRFDLSSKSADVLMRRLQTLSHIANADASILNAIAELDDSTKATLLTFFGNADEEDEVPSATFRHDGRMAHSQETTTTAVPTYLLQQAMPHLAAALPPPPPQNYYYTSPRHDSLAGMMQPESESRGMGDPFSPYDAGGPSSSWQQQQQDDMMRVTPQREAQQFVPAPHHGMMASAYQHGPMMMSPTMTSQRLLSRFNQHRGGAGPSTSRMGNAIRPMSFSVASRQGGGHQHHQGGHYRH